MMLLVVVENALKEIIKETQVLVIASRYILIGDYYHGSWILQMKITFILINKMVIIGPTMHYHNDNKCTRLDNS